MGHMPGRKLFVAALALGLAGAAAHAATVVDPGTARRAITQGPVVAADAELAELARAGRVSDLAGRLDRIAAHPALDPVAREWLLDQGLHELARLAPTPAARATVARLALRPLVVYSKVDPDHGDRTTPIYDVGATARFTMRAWERAGARDLALADLRGARGAVVQRFAATRGGARDPVRAGIVDAFREAPERLIELQRAPILSAIAVGQRVDELALVLALRLADAELLELVIGNADAPVALAAVVAVPRTFNRQTALELLAIATRRAEIGSAAVLAIGELAKDDGAARNLLFEMIEDAELGASAAAALGGLADPAVSAELGRRLRASRTESSRRLYALALRLDPGDAAREELRRFAATRTGSAQLQREVQQWLRR